MEENLKLEKNRNFWLGFIPKKLPSLILFIVGLISSVSIIYSYIIIINFGYVRHSHSADYGGIVLMLVFGMFYSSTLSMIYSFLLSFFLRNFNFKDFLKKETYSKNVYKITIFIIFVIVIYYFITYLMYYFWNVIGDCYQYNKPLPFDPRNLF